MGKVYSQGIVSPKGFNLSGSEPVDQRTIVEFKTDLYYLDKVYPGIKVQVLEQIDGEILREYKYVGGDSSLPASWTEVTGGAAAVVPEDLPLKFTSFVFIRNIGQPSTPTGGTYADPVPVGWSDTVPAGADPVWMSSAIFTQGSTDPIVWTSPILTEDTATTDFEYCNIADVPPADIDVDGKPLHPLEGAQRDYWHNEPTVDDNWMAIGYKVGGEYPTSWDIVKIGGEAGPTGDTGADGRAYQASIVFTRTNLAGMDTAVVSGGSFSSPEPTSTTIGGNPVVVSWSDGIPPGEEQVWMSKFVFNDVDHVTPSTSYIWTTPSGITDTSTDDFEFSSSTSLPADPDTDPGAWHDIATVNDIWMAHRSIKNGVVSAWGITRIKGETGATGSGLNIQGRDTITNIVNETSSPYELYDIWLSTSDEPAHATVPGTINDAYLYVGSGNGTGGTAWDNIGSITGTDGAAYLQSFVFIRSATQPATPSGGDFNSPIPAGWSDSIPAGTDLLWTSSRFFSDDAVVNAGLDDWKAPYLAQDTVDYDFKYADIQPADATPLPPDQAVGGVWYETPLTTSYWMAKGKKVNGTVDDTTWEVIRIKGEKGDTGDAGVPSFLSSAYIKTNDDISSISVTGGTYSIPVPTSTYNGDSWTDGIPAGNGAIWFVQVRFDQDDTGNDMVWPAPTKIADSTIVEYQFSPNVTKPVGLPTEAGGGTNGWYDTVAEIEALPNTAKWMAIGSKINGEWPIIWDIVSIVGETGADGTDARSFIPSTRFTRCDDLALAQVTVTGQYLQDDGGGAYSIQGANPDTDVTVGGYTYEFFDGVPAYSGTFPNNAYRVWMVQSVFNSVDHLGAGNEMQWGNPILLADTGSIDFKYHPGIGVDHTEPPNPDTDMTGWVEAPSATTYWIAQKNWADGVGAVWVVYQIRGEDGADGQSADLGSAPAQVTGLTHTVAGYRRVSLDWNTATDPDGDVDYYELLVINSGILHTTVQSYIHLEGLDPGINYDFRVRAVDAKGNKGPWSTDYTGTPLLDSLYNYSLESTGQATIPCTSGVSGYVPIWTDKDLPDLAAGDYIYTNSSLTIPLEGGSNWWKSSGNSYSIRIGNDGYVSAVANC